MQINIHLTIGRDWLTTGWARDSQTRTRLLDSLICITCSLESDASSVLHYVKNVALHYYGCLYIRLLSKT